MAFDKTHMAAMANADGQTWWQYKTEDAKSAIKAADYFNEVAHMHKVGDLIFSIMKDGYGIYRVKANASGVVAIDTSKIESS